MSRIIIFDMDGTIIDSSQDITHSINYVRSFRSLSPLSIEKIVDAINGGYDNLSQIFYETPTYEQSDRDRFEEHYEVQCTKNVSLYEEIKDTLDELKNYGHRLSIATNAPSKFARIMLSHVGVLHHFDHIYGADMVEHAKPNAQMLLEIFNDYGYEKDKDKKPLMVGDNHKDMTSAKNADAVGIYVSWGFSTSNEYEITLSKPSELIEIAKQEF